MDILKCIRMLLSKVYDAGLLNDIAIVMEAQIGLYSDEECRQFVHDVRECMGDYPAMSVYYRIFLDSLFVQVETDADNVVQALRHIVETTELSKEEKYFLIRQYDRIAFVQPEKWCMEADRWIAKLYRQVYEQYSQQFHDLLTPIPKEERDRNRILVFTTQMLGERHAPTHSTLERCYSLIRGLGKEVLLINTKEVLTMLGNVPFYGGSEAFCTPEYSEATQFVYKNCPIEFFQPEAEMPDEIVLETILGMVREWKPWLVLGMGDYSITADLCSNIVPEAALSFGFSTLPSTQGQMSILGRRLKDGELERLVAGGYRQDQIIESTFTFELHEQTKTLSREELMLPSDKFLLITIGNRLEGDVSDEFIEQMLKTKEWGTHLVLVGNMKNYELKCEEHPGLKEFSTFLGYQTDVLAVAECCDLYVNPKRLGGGFSIAECFQVGKPGVTIDYGDVAAAAGPDFLVKDYAEMLEVIKRYTEDKEFYQMQVTKGKQRLQVLLDGTAAMEQIMDKVENNLNFF